MEKGGQATFPAAVIRPMQPAGCDDERTDPTRKVDCPLFRLRWGAPAIVAATCVLLFLVPLGSAPLTEPDEGRHAEIAREMLATGNWLTPTLGFRPYHDKPILFYWLAAVAMRLFGINAWAARLPSALAACLGMALTAWWASRYLDRLTGTVAALLLATAGGYAGIGRLVLLDMVFSTWVTAGLFYGGAWFLEGRERGWPVWPFYALLSLGLLTKGPVALILTFLVFALFVPLCGLPGGLARVRPGQGAAVILVLGGSWYGAAALADPHYMWEFLWIQNVSRFASGEGAHRANPFAYLYWLPLTYLPWSLYLPAVFLHHRRSSSPASLPLQFCAVWVGVVFVFFSVSQGKLATYLLPLFPPLAILTADTLVHTLRREPLARAVRLTQRVALGVLSLVAVAAPIAAYLFLRRYAPAHGNRAALLTIALPFVLAGWRWSRRGRHDLTLVNVFAVAFVWLAAAYPVAAPVLASVNSLQGPAPTIASLPAGTRILSFNMEANTLRFYSRRAVESPNSLEEAAAALDGPGAVVLLTKRSNLEPLRTRLTGPLWVWWQDPRKKVLVANRPPPETMLELNQPVASATPATTPNVARRSVLLRSHGPAGGDPPSTNQSCGTNQTTPPDGAGRTDARSPATRSGALTERAGGLAWWRR